MVDGIEPIGSRIAGQRLEIEVPILAGLLQEIQQAAADAADRRNLEFSASARAMVLAASSTSMAMAQTPGPCATKCECAKPSGSQLITRSI
jgi:hypothetical protein